MDEIIYIKLKKTNMRVSLTKWDFIECEVSKEVFENEINKLLENNISSTATKFQIIVGRKRYELQQKNQNSIEIIPKEDIILEGDISEGLYNDILDIIEKEGKKCREGSDE